MEHNGVMCDGVLWQGKRSPPRHAPFLHFRNVYTKHNITTMLYYINIYIIIGAIVSALVILMNNYFVKYDDGTPLTNKDVVIIIFFWPIFLLFLFYYFFIKDWDN